jgi:SAM-dependent methyltransferase
MTSHNAKTQTQEAFDYGAIDAGYYDLVYRRARGIQSKWHHLKFAALRPRMAGHLGGRAGKHLDIGCGPGTFIGSLGGSLESLGADIAVAQIAYAQDAHGAPNRRFEVVPAGPLPFADAAFDVVTCIELAEHLPPATVLELFSEARRVLRPGGLFLATTPDYGGPWPALEWLLNRVGDVSYADQHITRFNRRKFRAILEEAGFAEISVGRYQWLAPFAAALGWKFADLIARLEPRWLTARLGFLLLAECRRADVSASGPRARPRQPGARPTPPAPGPTPQD